MSGRFSTNHVQTTPAWSVTVRLDIPELFTVGQEVAIMGRSTHSSEPPGGNLLGILVLVMVMAGAPILFKQARDAGRAVWASIPAVSVSNAQ
jgi:hypothetical protein